MTINTPKLLRVDIETESDNNGIRYVVWPIWADVDRPDSSGYSCGNNKQLAERLRNAMLSMKAFGKPEIHKDNAGKTFVSDNMIVYMRRANSDLRKLGF